MAIEFSDKVKNAQVNGVAGVHASGVVEIWTGAKPAGAMSTAPTGTLLAEPQLADPSHNAAVNKIAQLVGSVTAPAIATGNAQSFVIRDIDDAIIARGSCGIAGSGADMILSSVALVSGVDFTIESYPLAHP